MVNVVKSHHVPETPSQTSVAQNLVLGAKCPEFNNSKPVPSGRKSHSGGHRFLGGRGHYSVPTLFHVWP